LPCPYTDYRPRPLGQPPRSRHPTPPLYFSTAAGISIRLGHIVSILVAAFLVISIIIISFVIRLRTIQLAMYLLVHLNPTRVDAILHQQTDDFNASLLSEAVHFKSWSEAWFHKKDAVCLRQVDTHYAPARRLNKKIVVGGSF
jgi:hypothetical protein